MSRNKSIIFGPLPPPYGGVSVFMSAVSAAAARFKIDIWSYKGKSFEGETVDFRYLNHRRLDHIRALLRDGRRARISDSTHFHLEYPNPVLLPLWLICRFFLRFTWVKILHDGSLPERYRNFSRWRRRLFRWGVENVDEFIVYSRDLETWLREIAGAGKKISFIPLFFPPPPNWGKVELAEDLTEKIDRYAGYEKRVCSIGVFIPSYGFRQIAAAVEKLRAETQVNIGLLLVDGGFANDENFRSEVLRERDWIETARCVPHPALPRIFRQSDAFVRGFAHESYGLSRIEALLCGVPVIATNVGQTDGMLLYNFDDENKLLKHLRNILIEDLVFDASAHIENYLRESERNLEMNLRLIAGTAEESNP